MSVGTPSTHVRDRTRRSHPHTQPCPAEQCSTPTPTHREQPEPRKEPDRTRRGNDLPPDLTAWVQSAVDVDVPQPVEEIGAWAAVIGALPMAGLPTPMPT